MSTSIEIHFVSLNAQGLRDLNKRARLKQWMIQQKANILYIQETHFTKEMSRSLEQEFADWQVFHSFGKNNSRGVSIFIKKSLAFEVNSAKTKIDNEGRYILIIASKENEIFTLLNLYAPNDAKSRNVFFRNLNELMTDDTCGYIVLGGDFNEALKPVDRISSSQNVSQRSSPNLLKLISDHSLNDTWRSKHPNLTQFTWRRKNGVDKSRIDYWLIDENIVPIVSACDIRPALIQHTDHMAITLKLVFNNARGPGFWKFNNSLLEDQEYVKQINNLVGNFAADLQSDNSEPQLTWELCKIEIKGYTINYSKLKCKERKDNLQSFENELRYLNQYNDCNTNIQKNISDRITFLEKEIENIYSYKTKGAMIRSRIQLLEEGEKCTKYFMGLEKSRQTRKSIQTLKLNDKVITEQTEILNAEVNFYRTLYTSNNVDLDGITEYLDGVDIPVLDKAAAEQCEGQLTEQECYESLKDMKLNKSPGSDGLTVEFYRTFWAQIKSLLVQSLNSAYNKKQLSASQKHSILSLIYKKGDPTNIENWRPISLLNVDYKIATRCLSKRLQKVLPIIISTDQQGYVKNRFIGFSIRQIADIIDYADLMDVDGIVMCLDFKKAFDSVEHVFLFKVLAKFGFSDSFIQWVNTFYCNISSCLYNNGWKSDVFYPSRGLKQGCSLSALLYIIVAEIMAEKLRSNRDLQGIKIIQCDKSIKLTQLADDTTIFCKDEHDVKTALKIIEKFGAYSGLKLNTHKTEIMWIGHSKLRNDSIGDIKCSSKIKALGVIFSNDHEVNNIANWEKPLETVKQAVYNWSKRHLTFYGKITVIKSILLPKFVFLFQSLVVPKHIIDTINKMFYEFLWSGKGEKVKRKTLIGDINAGGLKMIDLTSFIHSIKIKWISALLCDEEANWKIIPRVFLNSFGDNLLIFQMNLEHLKQLPNQNFKVSDFYKNLVNIWLNFRKLDPSRRNFPKGFDCIRNQIIWGNMHLRVQGKCLLFKSWIKSGILFINDILGSNGCIDETIVINRLQNKSNWISELSMIKSAIPKAWREILKSKHSRSTKVKTKYEVTFNGKRLSILTNKDFYNIMIKSIFIKPYMHNKWETIFKERIKWYDLYASLSKSCIDNRVKQYKFKLLHNILAIKDNLYRWKIESNDCCCVCQVKEDLEHFFLNCVTVQPFWDKIIQIFEKCGISSNIKSMKVIVTGYKFTYERYNDVNVVLNLLGFCIYKAYYASEKRAKFYDLTKLFIEEFKFLYEYLKSKNRTSHFISKFHKHIR